MKKVGTKEIEAIYEYCKKVHIGSLSSDYAADLLNQTLGINIASAKMYFYIYKSLMCGDVYKRATSIEMTEYFVKNIYKENGSQAGLRSIEATEKHVQYLKNTYSRNFVGLSNLCIKLRRELA